MTPPAPTSAGLPDRNRLSICQITVRKASLPEQLRTIAEAGATGVGLFYPILPHGISADQVAQMLAEYGLTPTICVPSPFTLYATQRYSASLGRKVRRGTSGESHRDAMLASLRWLAPLRPSAVVVIPGAQLDRSLDTAWEQSRDELGLLADDAGKLDIQLALEPVHPRFSTDFSILDTVDSALRMVDEVGRTNVGVLLDAFHIWDTHDVSGQIRRAAGRISGVQLSDSATCPRSLVDRLIPGEGCADLSEIIAMILDTGYRGWFDCEVVSDDGSLGYESYPDSVWGRPPDAIATACVAGFESAVTRLKTAGPARAT